MSSIYSSTTLLLERSSSIMSARLVKAVLSTAVRLQLLRYTWCMRTVIDGHDGAKVRVRVITALGGEAVEIQVLKLILNGETLPLSEDLSKYSTLHSFSGVKYKNSGLGAALLLFSGFQFRYSAIYVSYLHTKLAYRQLLYFLT